MKRRRYLVLVMAGVAFLLVAGTVWAFAMGNVDGIWEYVEDNASGGAYCVTYATGFGTSETARSRNVPSIQGAPGGTDENQVHYGKGAEQTGDCPSSAPSSSWFDAQSGLGFDGNNSVGTNLQKGTPFLLGRLTHYNRPIYLTDDGSTPPLANYMEWVDIDVTVGGVTCSNGQPPNEGSTLTFVYRVNFDETPNACNTTNNQCKYQDYGVCPSAGCPDRVQVGTNPPSASFTCDDPDEPVQGIYTISLLGFVDNGSSTNCPSGPSGAYTTNYVTQENGQRNACLYAQISDFVPTYVYLKSFTATAGAASIVLKWETSSEVDNLGFNIYRAAGSEGAERVKLNGDLIRSNAYPGSMTGAQYTYEDTKVSRNTRYFYWLEDVDINGETSGSGPVQAVIGRAPAQTAGKTLRIAPTLGKKVIVPKGTAW